MRVVLCRWISLDRMDDDNNNNVRGISAVDDDDRIRPVMVDVVCRLK